MNFVKKNKHWGLLFILSIPDLFNQFIVLNHSLLHGLAFSIGLWVLILGLFMVFFYKNIRLYAQLLSILGLFIPILILPYYFTRTVFNKDTINLLTATNYSEISEFGYPLIAVILLVFLVLAILFLRFCFGLSKSLPKSINLTTSILVSVLSLSIFFGASFVISKATGVGLSIGQLLKRNSYISFALDCADYRNDLLEMETYKVNTKNFSFQAKLKRSSKQRRIFVLILGESSRYENWGLNGYSRNTTPLLSKRNDLIAFSNVSSGGSYTTQSVPMILTRATPENYELHFKEPTFAKAFAEVGFNTQFISMNEHFELLGSANTMHADNDYTATIWVPEKRKQKADTSSQHYDEETLPYINSFIDTTTKDVLIVVHTLGQHMKYYQRYPKSFEKFTPADYGSIVAPNKKAEIVNAYDNSIVYSDYLIDAIIKKVESQNCLGMVAFVADHGEELYDDGKTYGHGIASKRNFHVPMLIWASEAYKDSYANKIESLIKHKNEKISLAHNFFYSFLDLADIKHHYASPKESFASKDFQPSSQTVSGNNHRVMRFDQLVR